MAQRKSIVKQLVEIRAHFNILASGFLGGRAEAHPYKRRRAYSV
jgi:hypothetical protein